VVEDGVADPERNAVQGPREDHPRPGCRAAGDERADERHEQPDPPYPTRGGLVHHLDDVDALDRAVPRRQAPRDLEIAVDDREERGGEHGPCDRADGEALPEDRPQAHLSEPQPVHVEAREDDSEHDQDHRDDRRDRQAAPERVATAA